jgi:parallel beta-helix repeat protein
MPKKEKKKSWKERLQERQVKQQRAQESYQIQREVEAKKKPRKWPKGKILAAFFVIVLIFGVYAASQFIKPSTPSDGNPSEIPAGESIYIRSDGQVDPSAAPISNVGNNHYTFTADMSNPIIVERDNIVVDGADHALLGTDAFDSRGVDLTGRSNVTVTNVKIRDFDYGVFLSSSSGNVVSQNDFASNYCGVWIVVSSNDNVVSGNTIEGNEMYAVWLKDSSNNNISGNEITAHGNYTIYIRASDNTNISENYIADNNLGVFLYESSNLVLVRNDFVDNREPVSILDVTAAWDNGKEGNYWSDYHEKYPNATESGGIWNTPYVIDENNQDNYPLTNRVTPSHR